MPPPFINFTDMAVKKIKLPDNSVIPVEDSRIETNNPSQDQLLAYDQTSGKFINKTVSIPDELNDLNDVKIGGSIAGQTYFENVVEDYDGNKYDAIIIGEQVWLASNLRTTHYSDGAAVQEYYLPYGQSEPDKDYGLLYKWADVVNGNDPSDENPSGVQGIAPVGWHIPSKSEFQQLVDFVSGKSEYILDDNSEYIAKALASKTGWHTSNIDYSVGNNTENNNLTGLNIFPSGPTSDTKSYNAAVWSSSGVDSTNLRWHFDLLYNSQKVSFASVNVSLYSPRASVRCICDLTAKQFRKKMGLALEEGQHIVYDGEHWVNSEPEEQVQSDWNQTDSTAKDYIKNKPTITSEILICNYSNSAMDKTIAEIYEAFSSGKMVFCKYNTIVYVLDVSTEIGCSFKVIRNNSTSMSFDWINGINSNDTDTWTFGSNPYIPQEVLWCTYNDTNNTMNGLTVQQIIDAKTNNKIVCCKHGNLIHICTGASNSYIIFSCLTSGTTAGETVSASGNIVSYIVYSASSQAWGKSTIYLQEALTSGTNIKTINNESILGSGNITTPSGVVSCTYSGNMTTAGSITGLTLQEMYDAKTAGKEVLCMRGDEVYRLQTINNAFTYVIFQGVYSGHAAQIVYNPSNSLWYLAYASDMNVQSDWDQTNTNADDYIKNKPTLGTAAAKDSTNSVTANSTDLVESGAVKAAIDAAVSASYHHAGTKTVAELLPALLIADNEGNVYNITDSGETTSDFVEGSGKPINIGDNVGIAQVSAGVYKFDLLSGFIDTSNFATKDEVPQKIDDLSNVSVNTPSDKDILQYNADDSKWESKASPKMHIYPHNNVLCFDGYPFLFNESGLADEDVALIYKDKKTGLKKYLISDTASQYMSLLDSNRFELLPYVRFHRGKNGRSVAMHKTGISGMLWAADNKYILECDLTADGGFTWAITVNDKVSGGTVEWTAGVTTLSDIVSQLVSGRHSDTSSTYLDFTLDDNENPTKIRIRQRTYTNSTFTLSNNTGATLTDLSTFCKIGETAQGRDHRTWQAQSVTVLFPSSGIIAPNTVQYSVSGLNLSYRCGGNETRYKTYDTANGSTSYLAESSVSSRMTPTAFANLNGSGVAEQQALYDKYDGSWDAYMEASMIALDDTHTNGIEYQSYDNGDTQTAFLASVMTMDFDGTYVPAYPAAYAAHSITSKEFGAGNMPTNHEIGVFMRDDKLAKINAAFSLIGGATNLANTSYYWSVAQYSSTYSWFYYGYTGTVAYTYKYNSIGGRSLVYLNS